MYAPAPITAGSKYYVDRPTTIADVPLPYQGAIWIKTANSDKSSAKSPFLTFDIDEDAEIYVGHDFRIFPKPAWLNSWKNTRDDIADSSGVIFRLYKKAFPAGKVVLGPNVGSGANMYVVLVQGTRPVLRFSQPSYRITENGGKAAITVYRAGPAGPASVQYATSDGTARSGSDYVAVRGTLNWADGDLSSRTILVPIINDTSREPDETVNLTLSNPTGAAQRLAPPAPRSSRSPTMIHPASCSSTRQSSAKRKTQAVRR